MALQFIWLGQILPHWTNLATFIALSMALIMALSMALQLIYGPQYSPQYGPPNDLWPSNSSGSDKSCHIGDSIDLRCYVLSQGAI